MKSWVCVREQRKMPHCHLAEAFISLTFQRVSFWHGSCPPWEVILQPWRRQASTKQCYKAQVCHNHIMDILLWNKQLAGSVLGLNTNLASPAQAEVVFKTQNISLHHSDNVFPIKGRARKLKERH